MKLSENPIFLTHKRLVHRGGVLAAIIIAALLGVSFFLGLISWFTDPTHSSFSSRADEGRFLYGWIIGLEFLILILGGFSRISRTLSEDRKAGLWDSNRLTPLKPAQIVIGYWLAPALREFYMTVVLAVFGLLIVLVAGLSPLFWLGTQTLTISTALFFGLLGVLSGMVFQRSPGILVALVYFIAWPFALMAPNRLIVNFLLPIYGIVNFFDAGEKNDFGWNQVPKLFGMPISPVILTLGLQGIIGFFIWRLLLRKTAKPFQPLLLRNDVIFLFSTLIIFQHALIWDFYRGKFSIGIKENNADAPMLPSVHGATVLIGILMLTLASPLPEQIRLESLRHGFRNLGTIFSRSSVALGVILASISALGLLTQCGGSFASSYPVFLITVLNELALFIGFALLLEFCRLRHQRRAMGFMILWLFIFCALPFILGGIFQAGTLAYFSFLAPGFVATKSDVSDVSSTEWELLASAVCVQLLVVLLLFIAWCRQWKQLLQRSA